MAESSEKLLIDIRELSELTGMSIGTLYHWSAAGRLPCIRFSARCLRFRLKDVEAWLTTLAVPVIEEPIALFAQRPRSIARSKHPSVSKT